MLAKSYLQDCPNLSLNCFVNFDSRLVKFPFQESLKIPKGFPKERRPLNSASSNVATTKSLVIYRVFQKNRTMFNAQ